MFVASSADHAKSAQLAHALGVASADIADRPAALKPVVAPTPEAAIEECDLLGIPFAAINAPAVVSMLSDRANGERFVYVATPNVHHLVLLRRGVDGFSYGLSRAWLLTCDSRILQHIGRLLLGRALPLVTGSDLTVHLLRHVITVIGGSDELRRDLRDQYGLQRIALYSPPFGFSRNEAELRRCMDFVRDNPARFVFLACGAPQSEVLAARLVDEGGARGIGLCIGASLLFATGRLKRAPLAWQRLSLEWLHRLTQDPPRMLRRLWRAQLPVLGMAAAAWASRRSGNAHASLLDRPARRFPVRLAPEPAGLPVEAVEGRDP
jgi:exopolysaccharide biosynthesis WecB/TagA/CpsF family protein